MFILLIVKSHNRPSCKGNATRKYVNCSPPLPTKRCIDKLWLIAFEKTKPRKKPHSSHSQGNRGLKAHKDKDYNKSHQNGFPRDSHSSKPDTHLIYSKNYKKSQILLKTHNTKQKCNRSKRSKLIYTYVTNMQRIGTRSHTLFQDSQSSSCFNSTSNHASQLNPVATQASQNVDMTDISSGKRQVFQGNSQPNKKPTPHVAKGTSSSNLNLHDLWLGFQNMEMLAIDLSVEPYVYSLEACL